MVDLDLVNSLFAKKDYPGIKKHIESSGDRHDSISSESDAELLTLLAFTYHNLGEHRLALKYARLVVGHLKAAGQVVEARDLFENLMLVSIDSLVSLGRPFRAFVFCRMAKRQVVNEREELAGRSKYIRECIAELASSRINNSIYVVVVIISVTQILLGLFTYTTFVWITSVLLALSVYAAAGRSHLKKSLNKLFDILS